MKNGFTLAEVLITLGIIGIVAAITIPGLITEHQKKATVTKLERAISVLNQAYKLSYDDVGEPSVDESFGMGSVEYFKTYWEPYIKTALICNSYSQCGYDSKAPWKFANGKASQTSAVAGNQRTTFYTLDGILYVIFTAGGGSTPGSLVKISYILIDLNGGGKPNKIGKDVFYLTRVTNNGGGGVQPYGYNLSNRDVNQNCSKTSSGMFCAEKIRRAGWRIEKDYPW